MRDDAERIDAGRVLEEQVQEIERHERHVFNPAISEFIAMMNQVDEVQELRAKIAERQMLEGVSKEERVVTDREVKEFLEKPEVKDAFEKKKVAERKLRQTSEKLAQLEAKDPGLAEKFASNEVESLSLESASLDSSGSTQNSTTAELLDLFEYSRNRQERSSAIRDIWETVASVTEHADAFAKEHPKMAKYGSVLLEGTGYAMASTALCGAAQVGPLAFLATGSSMWVQNEVMAAVIEHGAEALIDNAASQGQTEAEAVRYAKAAVRSVELGLNGLATFGVFKIIKNGSAVLSKYGGMKATVIERAKAAFLRTKASKAKFDAVSSQGLYDAINKSPYHPRMIELLLKERYGETEVVSTTMTGVTGRNVGLSGKGHSVTGIPFTEKGAPIFDSVAVCDLRIPREIAGIDNMKLHFKTATKELNRLIETGVISKSHFSSEALSKIEKGSANIPGFTWHHHEDNGRMQLVPRLIHEATGHDGGMKFWPFTVGDK